MSANHHVIVIGAGVIGLSTAIRLQELGYRVTILAECIPGDPKSIRYTSPWAGAHHVSSSSDPFIRDISRKTFDLMWEMSEPGHPASGCFRRIQQSEYYEDGRAPTVLEFMPEYRRLNKDELPPGCESGETFKTVTIDVPVYLPWLMAKFLGGNGQLKRVQVQHIIQAATGAHAREADAIVVCTGLGTRFLGGVEDTGMFPNRGQTILIDAPWIEVGWTKVPNDDHVWSRAYVVPRRSGEVILGGTMLVNDWHPTPRPETAKEIITKCLEICPELVPPSKREKGKTPTVDDITPIIIEEGCGLRPGRKGGIRIESGVMHIEGVDQEEKKIPIVYNYGHGGIGYQSSWGSAILAAKLLHEAMNV